MHKKLAAVLLAALMAFQMPCAGVQAAKKTYMEKLNINWDLRPDGVAIPFDTYVAGVGYRQCTVKFKTADWNTLENGRVHVKLKAVFREKYRLTDNEIHKAANSVYGVKSIYSLHAVDYKTGKLLDVDGKVKSRESGSKPVYDRHGCGVETADTVMTWEFETDMPRDGVLCIQAGGCTEEGLQKYESGDTEKIEKLGDIGCVDKENSQVCHVMKLAFHSE